MKETAEHKCLREEITWKAEQEIIYKIFEQIVSNFLDFFCLWEKKSGQGALWGKADMTGRD